MGNILIVGAGREGKGFLGQAFSAASWNVAFLDRDEEVIEALEQNGSYEVKLLQEDATVYAEVSGYRTYGCDEEHSCMREVLDADLIALCIYPEDIPEAAVYLAPCIEERAEQGGKKLTILSCTNLNHFIEDVEGYFMDALGERARAWFADNVAVRDVIVRRSVGADSAKSLKLEALAVATLLIQPPIYVDLSEVPWMELQENLEALKDMKLYTYNAPHAACAYAGYQKGYETIGQAEQDEEVAALMGEVLKEAVKALSLEFHVEEEEIWKFCTLPSPKEVLVDTIFRVGYDPIRKLGREDRLTGNACFCYKHHLPYEALAKSMANGFAYDQPGDEKAAELQRMIVEMGIEKTAAQVCGLPEDHEIVKKVAKYYGEMIAQGK